MSQPPSDSDPKNWHRYFAIEYNNLAWDLSVQARSLAQDLEIYLITSSAISTNSENKILELSAPKRNGCGHKTAIS